MNRLPDPDPADRVSGAALSPCSNGSQAKGSERPAGSESPPLDAPADLPLVGLHRTLGDFALVASRLQATTGDIAFRRPQDPIALCHWLDLIKQQADEVTSLGMALHHMADQLGDRAYAECMKRYRAQVEEVHQRGAVHVKP